MTSPGSGYYQWVDLDGSLCQGAHWDDLPEAMDRIVRFEPDVPPPPHTQEEHELMASYNDKFLEALSRCRR